MKTQPVVPARIDWSDGGAPFAPDFGDRYHSRDGALAQAQHVFIGGNGLPARWRGRDRFALLETGFGLGNNFLATWSAWRADPRRCARLSFVSIEKHPPTAHDLERAHTASPLRALSQALITQWPPLTPNLHRLAFDDCNVELLLLFADVADAVGEIVGRFDAFMLDGFAPVKNPAMWQPCVFAALGRLAAPDATAATWSVAREVRDGLARAGFSVELAPGFGSKREMTVASFAPRHRPPPLPGRPLPGAARDVVIVGAGLAGCAAAAALVEDGFDVNVIERCRAPALGASGQPAGLFHGVVHGADGPHARFTRAAALLAGAELGNDAIARRGVPGRHAGVLRVERTHAELPDMHAMLSAQGLPPRYVQALDAAQASALAGMALGAPAWHYPGGGWIDPRALCSAWLAGPGIEPRRGEVASLRRGGGERWQLLGSDRQVVATASIVVLAGGADGAALLDTLSPLPLAIVRGQSLRLAAGTPGLRAPALPIAGAGYAVTLDDGSVLCGASRDIGDTDLAPREPDRFANLQRLERLTGSEPVLQEFDDAVGLRLLALDRLPLIGAMPAAQTRGGRLDQPRFVPRAPALFVFSAFGSRGITWAPLGARLLAAQIAGRPWPLEADLADAIDPARFVARAVRKSAS